jgi:probable rRNA maturation factor
MKKSQPAPEIAVMIEEPLWREEGRGLPQKLRRAARTALESVKDHRSGQLTILLAGDAKLKALNTRFRGKNKPTNVLSFPAADRDYLGDVAIAYGVCAQEAETAAKSLQDHAIHLAVHGVLHLLGYDHESAREARIMEPIEIAVLAKLGVADPYAARPAAASDGCR